MTSIEAEAIVEFLGKKVKLVLYPNFVLIGTIEKVHRFSILFKTDQGTSLISTSHIKTIMEMG